MWVVRKVRERKREILNGGDSKINMLWWGVYKLLGLTSSAQELFLALYSGYSPASVQGTGMTGLGKYKAT